jgi:hypothetical protein
MTSHLQNFIRIVEPGIKKDVFAAMHHFKNRHDGRGFGPARMWIQAARNRAAACGYDIGRINLREFF